MAEVNRPARPHPPRKATSCPVGTSKEINIPICVPPLPSNLIRWFYCEPGKYWKPFNGHDSLELEQTRCNLINIANVNPEIESKEVEVMGNMFVVEVHVSRPATLCPIYWNVPKPWSVLRGTWFEVSSSERWYPVNEKDSALLEEAHTRKDWREKAKADAEMTTWAYSGIKVEERRGSQPHDGYEAVWIGENEVMKMKTDIASKLWNKVGEKVGKGQLFGSTHLIRGYRETAVHQNMIPPIGHLVFVIHGIGQNMEASNIIKSASDLRETCTAIAQKHFPEKWKEKRVEFIPIEWRTWLSLDEGMLYSITPHGLKSLRGLLNDSVLDVMFYLSPRYGPEILDGLRWQLHKKYNEFMSRNSGFLSSGGTVSLFAHSLGSVMCYDLLHETSKSKGLLRHYEKCKPKKEEKTDAVPHHDEQLDELRQLRVRVAELESKLGIAHEPKVLTFSIDHFFAVGSPLGIFIILREHDEVIKKEFRGADSFLPSCICKRIHNVHHPSDPVAYRLEPLINSAYSQIKPVKIDSAGSKPSEKSKGLAEGSKPLEAPPNRSTWWSPSLLSSVVKSVSGSTSTEAKSTLPQDKIFNDDNKLLPEDRLKERLDFMLREGLTENSYLNAITAHTCYWTNADCAMYVLLQLYSYKKEK